MDGKTTLVGLMGWPLSYSLSPAMHNKAFQALGLNYAYVPLRINPEQTNNLQAATQALRACNFRGANVTIPYKQLIITYLDSLSPASMRAQSVNTVVVDPDGLIHGDTTDGPGFILDLKNHNVDVSRISAALIGAGGCAHALAFSLLENGCTEVNIYNRSAQNAEALMASLNSIFPNRARVISLNNLKDADLVVNTTPPNMLSDLIFKPGQIIYDTNYMCDAVNIKKSAELAGCVFISGIGMLLYSGALSFEFFTGHKAPIDVMRNAL